MTTEGDLVDYQAKDAYQKAEVARSYDDERFKSAIGRYRHRKETALIDWAMDAAGVREGATVADIPTGTGRFVPLLHQKGISVTAVDVSQAMLEVARNRESSIRDSVEWVTADATKLPFADDSFDAVMSIRLMNHLPLETRAKVLAEFSRVSRSHVLVAFTDGFSVQRVLRAGSRRRRNVPQYPAGVAQARMELLQAGLELIATKHLIWGISETYMCVARVVHPAE